MHESYAVFNRIVKVKFRLHALHASKPLDLKKQGCERNSNIFHHSAYVSIHLLSSSSSSPSTPPPFLLPMETWCVGVSQMLLYNSLIAQQPALSSVLLSRCLSVFRVLPFLHSCVASDAQALQELLALLISLRPISRRGGVGGCFAQSPFVSVHSPSLCTTAT